MDFYKRHLLKKLAGLSILLTGTSLHSEDFLSLDNNNNFLFNPKNTLINKVKNKVPLDSLGSIIPKYEFDYQISYNPSRPEEFCKLFVAVSDHRLEVKKSRLAIKATNDLSWVFVEHKFTLADFGAVPNSTVDSSDAIEFAFNSGLILHERSGNEYTLNKPIIVKNVPLQFSGLGNAQTFFLINHVNHGIVYGQPKPSEKKYPVNLSDFCLKRLNNGVYSGNIGAKGLYIGNANPVVLSGIEECYGFGYGIHIDYSEDILVERCYVHDHKGMAGGQAGTDGIHVYRSKMIIVRNNIIHDIGDDAISVGSFDKNHSINDVVVSDNKVYSTKGGIKVYSFASDILIENNKMVACREGGVYLTDDKNSPNNSLIENVKIRNNVFISIGIFGQSDEAGALRIRFWPTNNSGSKISDIYFINNVVKDSRLGVSELAYGLNKRLANIYIENNMFSFQLNKPNAIIKDYYINLTQCDGDLIINNNEFSSAVKNIIILNDKFDGFRNTKATFKNNIVEGIRESTPTVKVISHYQQVNSRIDDASNIFKQ